MDEITIKFLTHKWCPFAHRVWLFLEELRCKYNIQYVMVEIELYNKPKWFLQLNPKGLVPVIVVTQNQNAKKEEEEAEEIVQEKHEEIGNGDDTQFNEQVVTESVDICMFLDKLLSSKLSNYTTYYPESEKEQIDYWLQMCSDKLLTLGKQAVSCTKNVDDFMDLLDDIDKKIKENNNIDNSSNNEKPDEFYLCGRTLTVADIILWPMIHRINGWPEFNRVARTNESFTNIQHYIKSMQKLTCVRDTNTDNYWWWW